MKTRAINPPPPVICVDLDGTLVATNTLWESLLKVGLHHPLSLFPLIAALFQGKTRFKEVMAGIAIPNVKCLPYRQELLEYLRAQKASGRRLVLATAAHQSIANAVAEHLCLFDEVIATDKDENLSGRAKGKLLAERFGEGGFCYAGNGAADFEVWQHAGSAVAVCVPNGSAPRIAAPVEARFHEPHSPLRTLFQALRVHQWVKNLLVFVPLFTSRDMLNAPAAERLLLAAVALSLVASAQYLLNDLVDLESDREHFKRKSRPFASGNLPIQSAISLVPLLLAGGAIVGYAAGAGMAESLLGGYFLASILYSWLLKTKALVDVFTLAGLYTFRMVIGGFISGHHVTAWLLNFSFLCFLSLGFLKRYIELSHAERDNSQRVGRRGYYSADAMILAVMGVGSSFAAAVVLALYVYSESANILYARPMALWGIVPVSLLVQCRLWLCASRGYIEDDPVRYVLTDRVAWAGAAVGAVVYLAAIKRI